MNIVSILLVLIFSSKVYSYTTHSGKVSLNDLADEIIEWLQEDKPEETDNENYNIKTHPWLTLRSIQLFEHNYNTSLDLNTKQQIILGSIEEDFDIDGTSTIEDYSHLQTSEVLDLMSWGNWGLCINLNRTENHFFNYDSDIDGLTYGTNVDTNRNTSALKWAKDDLRNLTNFIKAIAEGNSKNGWRCIGHILHLLQDMSVPAHVRNDAHIFNKDIYEIYLENKRLSEYSTLVELALEPSSTPSFVEIDDFSKKFNIDKKIIQYGFSERLIYVYCAMQKDKPCVVWPSSVSSYQILITKEIEEKMADYKEKIRYKVFKIQDILSSQEGCPVILFAKNKEFFYKLAFTGEIGKLTNFEMIDGLLRKSDLAVLENNKMYFEKCLNKQKIEFLCDKCEVDLKDFSSLGNCYPMILSNCVICGKKDSPKKLLLPSNIKKSINEKLINKQKNI